MVMYAGRAIRIGSAAKQLVTPNAVGVVHSVFTHSMNIMVGSAGLITMTLNYLPIIDNDRIAKNLTFAQTAITKYGRPNGLLPILHDICEFSEADKDHSLVSGGNLFSKLAKGHIERLT